MFVHIISINMYIIGSETSLYLRIRLLVGRSVGWSVALVGRYVCLSVIIS